MIDVVELPQRKLRVPKNRAKTGISRKKRKKSELTKLKEELWRLTRIYAAQIYPHECYTCGVHLRWGSSVMQLGHFIPRAICSQELHFDLKNLRWQCRICNQFKNGRWPEFEERLIREHGLAYVEDIKERNRATKGTTYPKGWYHEQIALLTKKLQITVPV